MKSKLAASFLFSLSGTRWRNSRSTMPLRSTVNYLNHRRFQISCSFRAEESSSRAVHSSAISDDVFSDLGMEISECPAEKIILLTEKPDDFVDDDFVELGPPISDCAAKQLKLVTEKRDPFQKIRPCKREATRRPLSSHKMSAVQERLSAVIKKASMATDPNLHGHDHSPSFTDDTRNISDTKGTLYISIKNIPSTVNLAELVEAISVFGKVSGASFVRTSNKLRCCNIEFEDVDSSHRAILSGKVIVRSQVFPVDPLDTVDLVTIRISNISYQTSDYMQVCW